MNTFVFFLARIIGGIVDKVVLKNERGTGIGYFVTVIVAQIVLGFLAGMVVAWFSRHREFRADAGGAHLAGTNSMIGRRKACPFPYGVAGADESLRHPRGEDLDSSACS
jgi:heat shock protein HtpX